MSAIVSILGTVSKASLALSLTAVIGHKKWLRYQEKAHQLHDLQSFDDASRGPLGSTSLMFSPSAEVVQTLLLLIQALIVCRSTTRIVAFVLLVSVATDPFFQQLISYSVRAVPSVNFTASINETAAIAKLDEMYTYLFHYVLWIPYQVLSLQGPAPMI